MIVSASRRTDIPACHLRWFLGRMEAGFALVENPRNPRRLSRIPLQRGTTDCIVFWSKNPAPMLRELQAVEAFGIPFYLQFTLTPYGPLLEPGLPDKKTLLRTFHSLSEQLGPERVVWRYDPILMGDGLSAADHLRLFDQMAGILQGYTRRCVLSFLDLYPHIKRRMEGMGRAPSSQECRLMAQGFAETAARTGIRLFSCCEEMDLSDYGVSHAACIDPQLVEQVVGAPIRAKKDPGQRPQCGCIESADIGAYDSCPLGCRYCYGNRSRQAVLKRMASCDPSSPMLCGWPTPEQQISTREFKSLVESQCIL